jgi:uncharacterized cupredoxin-like copper-binding protein
MTQPADYPARRAAAECERHTLDSRKRKGFSMMMKPGLFAAALAATLIAAAPARAGGEADHMHMPMHEHGGHDHDHGASFGEPGDPAKPAREIALTMTEADGKMLFSPNTITVSEGEQIRFQLKNAGQLDHEIVLATLKANLEHAKEMEEHPDMQHDDPNAKRLAPGASAEILWKFTKAGTFDFSCLIPGHREAGMFGTVVVR